MTTITADYQEEISRKIEQYTDALVVQTQLRQELAEKQEQIRKLMEQLKSKNPEIASNTQETLKTISGNS